MKLLSKNNKYCHLKHIDCKFKASGGTFGEIIFVQRNLPFNDLIFPKPFTVNLAHNLHIVLTNNTKGVHDSFEQAGGNIMRQGNWMPQNTPHNAFKGLFKVIGTFALFAGLCLMTALPAVAADEAEINDVIINGYKLGFFEQWALEDHIDQDIPDGYYWFELETGMWGPVGGSAIVSPTPRSASGSPGASSRRPLHTTRRAVAPWRLPRCGSGSDHRRRTCGLHKHIHRE